MTRLTQYLTLLGSCAALARGSPVLAGRDACSMTSFAISNGDFESGSLAPWLPALGSDNATVSVVSPGESSNYAVQLEVGYTAAIQQQHIPLCAGFEYQISVDYKVLAAGEFCHLHLLASHGDYQVVNDIVGIYAADWKTTTWYWRDMHSDAFVLGVQLRCVQPNTSATVLLDNWTLEQTRDVDPADCPVPIPVGNGGFETGALAPWTELSDGSNGSGGVSSIVSPGYQSNSALQVDFTPDAVEVIGYFIDQLPFVTACVNDYNTVSLAVNWLDYTGPLDITDPNNYTQPGCIMAVNVVGCIFDTTSEDVAFIPPSAEPGWQYHQLTCLRSQHRSDFSINIQCNPYRNGPTIAPFSFQWDDISVAASTNGTEGGS